jgi:HEXXH motif-containing protein
MAMSSQATPHFPMAEVLEILQWRGRTSLEDELWSTHRSRLEGAFDDVTRGPLDRHGILAGLFADLPESSRLRFLTGPETACRLFLAKRDVQFLLGALLAEARLADDGFALPASVWTATGDWYFPKQARGATVDDECFEWAPDQPFRAPTVGNGIPVDLVSPYVRRRPTHDMMDPYSPMTPEDGRQVVAELRSALALLERASPSAGRVHDRFIRAIVVQRSPEPRERLGSYSWSCFVGRTTLQFSADRHDDVHMADALVHEAIHAFLYILAQGFPFVQDGVDPAYRIRSLWSGRLLDPIAFTHAVFVWFGLWQFWRQAVAGDIFPRDAAVEHLTRARRGFEGSDLRGTLVANEGVLAPYVLTGLASMLDEIERGSFDAPILDS